MPFSQQELDIIKYGQANGKSRAEVEQALSNFRNGIKQQKAVQTEETGLGSQLAERGKTLGRELLSIGTLGASTLSKQDVQEARQSPEQAGLVALQAFNRAFQSPARAAMAVGGAVGDVVGAGLEKTGIDKTIAENVAPVVNPVVKSGAVKKLVENFSNLDPEVQDYLKGIPEIANIIGLEAIPGAITKQIGKIGVKTSALDAIKSSSGNLTQKALDFISADPEKKVATILKESTPEQLDNYLGIAEKAASDPRIATPFEVVGNKLSDTTKILETRLKDIGARKSAVIEPMREGLGSFKKETTPLIQKLTSLKNSFTEIDASNKSKVQAIINDAKTIATKKDADAFIDKAQNALYVGNVDMTIPRGSALDKQLRGIIGEYNTSLKNALPEEYGALNKQYSDLIDSLDVINRSLGEVVEGVPVRGASLIKQFFSPSGTKAKEIFEFVKKETNGEIDLAKDATLAKFSMDLFDDPRSRSLLAGIGDIPTTLGGVATKVAEKLGGEKLQEAMRGSTIRKAKEISSPKSAKESYSAPKVELKSESPSSLNSTPETVKSKGIRGMIDFGEIGVAFTPSEKSIVKQALEDLKLVKSESGRMEMLKPVKELLIKEKIISPSEKLNSNKIEEAAWRSLEDSDAVMAAVKKQEMSTPFVKQSEERLGSKKKVVSEPTKVYHGTTEAKPGVSSGGNLGNGTYYFKDKKMALEWGGNVHELDFPINPKVYKNRSEYESDLNALIKSETGKNSTKEISDAQLIKYQKALNEKLQNSGYDGIDLPDGGVLFKKSVSSLEQEAKKYKSAEEFVKAQGTPVYHGSKVSDIIEKEGFKLLPKEQRNMASAYGDGIYLTTSKSDAKGWGGMVNARIPPDLKLYKAVDSDAYKIDTQKLVKEGYDGVKVDRGNLQHIVIFNPTKIKTKSQLTDIWNKANAGSKVDPLIVEAKKYKTPEELDELTGVPIKEIRDTVLKQIKKDRPDIINKDNSVTLYHGTPNSEKIKKSGYFKSGTYFTADENVAKNQYANKKGFKVEKITVMPEFLDYNGNGIFIARKNINLK